MKEIRRMAHCHCIYLSIYIIQSSVCLFAVNTKTTTQIDAIHSGFMKNDLESVLRRLKSPVLMLSGRYHEISSFSLLADHHFYLSPFPLRLLQVQSLCMHALHVTTLKHCHIVVVGMTLLQLPNSLLST